MYDVNIGAVLVAAIANIVLGTIWYSSSLFGKVWMKHSHINPSKGHMKAAYIGGFVTSFVTAFVLLYLFQYFGVGQMAEASFLAFVFWLGFYATTGLGSVLWEKKPVRLYLVHAGYSLVSLQVMSSILFFMK